MVFSNLGVGTVSVSGTAVTGVGTAFTTTFNVGDIITVQTSSGSETKTIASIASDTSLAVTSAFLGTASSVSYGANAPGIVEMVRRLTNTDVNTYPIDKLCADINSVYDDYVSIILSSDTRWTWDDANFSTFPIATTNLVNGQRDYQFTSQFLKILKVLVLNQNANGTFGELVEINLQDSMSNLDAWEMNVDDPASNLGIPDSFTLFGDSLRLQPRPNYNATGGIKVYFQRYEAVFIPTDTTKVPGFPQPFHRGLAFGAAHLFSLSHNLPQVDRIEQEDINCREALSEYFSERNKAERPVISMRRTNPS